MVAFGFFLRPLGDAASVASAYLLPSRIDIAVEPGDARVRTGQSLTVRARVRGADAVAPSLVTGEGAEAVPVPMTRQDDGSYLATVDDVTASFVYRVVAGARRSDAYAVTVVHPPTVERIALEYRVSQGPGAGDARRGRRRRHLRAVRHRGAVHHHHRSSGERQRPGHGHRHRGWP